MRLMVEETLLRICIILVLSHTIATIFTVLFLTGDYVSMIIKKIILTSYSMFMQNHLM